MRGWKNIFHANGKQKKAGVAIFISDKIDLKIKRIQENQKDLQNQPQTIKEIAIGTYIDQ